MSQGLSLLGLCLTFGGCSLLFEPDTDTGTGAVGSCSELGTFGSPALISIPGIAGAEEPTLSGDLLEIIFDGKEDGAVNNTVLYSATRESVADDWEAPRELVEVRVDARISHPALSADGQTLRFCSGSPFRIYVSRRLASGGFGLPVTDLLPVSNSSCPGWVNDEDTLMVLDIGIGQEAKLFVTRRENPDEPWGEPIELTGGEAPLPLALGSPSYLECAGELWFHGADGIYAAEWDPAENSLGAIRLMGEFTGVVSGRVENPWPSKDGKRIFFSVGFDGGRMYEATRSN